MKLIFDFDIIVSQKFISRLFHIMFSHLSYIIPAKKVLFIRIKKVGSFYFPECFCLRPSWFDFRNNFFYNGPAFLTFQSFHEFFCVLLLVLFIVVILLEIYCKCFFFLRSFSFCLSFADTFWYLFLAYSLSMFFFLLPIILRIDHGPLCVIFLYFFHNTVHHFLCTFLCIFHGTLAV